MSMTEDEVNELLKDDTTVKALTIAYDVKHKSMHPVFVDRVFKLWTLKGGKPEILDTYVVTAIRASGSEGLKVVLKSDEEVIHVGHRWEQVGDYDLVVKLPTNCETRLKGGYDKDGEPRLSFTLPMLIGVMNHPKFKSKNVVWFDPIGRIKQYHPDENIKL